MSSYRDAGVDLDAADHHVGRIAGSVTSTWGSQVVGLFGGFAAGVRLPAGLADPVLMMTTDGVGTKLELARRAGLWEGVGQDLVAMAVDDLAVMGARPLGLVDYMAVGALDDERDATIIASIAGACRVAGCPLLGGETAEHPGVMAPDTVDLAATAMGVVEAEGVLGPERVSRGDLVVGLTSPNLRSNGFSLVRRLFDHDLEDHAATLLEPSVIYSPAVIDAVSAGGVHAAAHVTGGGIVSNLGRSLPDGLGVKIETETWQPPAMFRMVQDRGVTREEMFAVFNMGIGFCLIVEAGAVASVMRRVDAHHPVVIGEVDDGGTVSLT